MMDNVLLYGGLAVAGSSLVIGAFIVAVLWILKLRLNAKLDSEYGIKKK